MTITIDLQNDAALERVPRKQQFQKWVAAALLQHHDELEQTIRIVDETESRELNGRFRNKANATNVLAFPADSGLLDYDCLGDLVICAPIVVAEAETQGKPVEAHWAHLVVHGMLHLQGFDHGNDDETAQMEAREIKILNILGYTNPYNDSGISLQ
ncbi:MAG: rRNA maturation RNase YbeY [Gammaproteobacteria bacterium]|nr:rRNA maturation RNase YbeY [Gammaproteobacteria bacterium]